MTKKSFDTELKSRNPNYSFIEPNGSLHYNGPSEIYKSDRYGMVRRDFSYRPEDERFHLQSTSLGGTNSYKNVCPGTYDVNHRAWLSMENAEKNVLNSGGKVYADKIAFVSNQAGGRPDVFLANNQITLGNHTETLHHSFTNEPYAFQEICNELSADNFAKMADSVPNPGDALRAENSTTEYAVIMEKTDAELPNIADDYIAADFSGCPPSCLNSELETTAENVAVSADLTVEADTAVEAEMTAEIAAEADCEML